MPYLTVPLTRRRPHLQPHTSTTSPSSSSSSSSSSPSQQHHTTNNNVRLSYNLRGHGHILVLLLPGLCVPSSMYDTISSFLISTSQFTTISLDNRGIGESTTPPFTFSSYHICELAFDAWDVIDHVRSSHAHRDFHAQVALVGHSMGGMIVQNMLMQRPYAVRYVALLATHAGGLWNLVPSLRLLKSVGRVMCSGFDPNVHAAENLNLHFTKRFLDDVIGIDDDFFKVHATKREEGEQQQGKEEEKEEEGEEMGGDGNRGRIRCQKQQEQQQEEVPVEEHQQEEVPVEEHQHNEQEQQECSRGAEHPDSSNTSSSKDRVDDTDVVVSQSESQPQSMTQSKSSSKSTTNNHYSSIISHPSTTTSSSSTTTLTTTLTPSTSSASTSPPSTTTTIQPPPSLLLSSSSHSSSSSSSLTKTGLRQRHPSSSSSRPRTTSRSPSSSLYRGINFVESKLIEFARDAHLYFGLSVSALPDKLRHPKQSLLDAVVSRAQRYRTAGRRRWDIYHARYTGKDLIQQMQHDDDSDIIKSSALSTSLGSTTAGALCGNDGNDNNEKDDNNNNSDGNNFPTKTTTTTPSSSSSLSSLSSSSTCGQTHHHNDHSTTPNSPPPQHQQQSSSNVTTVTTTSSPSPTSSTFLGHFFVVLSHSLPSHFARALRRCESIVKLVVIGKHDSVVTPSSSRALASAIDANTVIEIDAAHFVTDEAAPEITTHLVYGLRKAFFAPVGRPCTCPWCVIKK